MNTIIIRSEDLKDICSKILAAVDSTELSLVTETLELSSENNVLSVCVTNREYFTEVKLPVDDVNNFKATVNATLFLKLISQITTDTIELNITDKVLVVKANGTYKLPLIFDGENLLSLPRINIENVTSEFNVSSDILKSILQYNSKELTKGTISKPVQKLYYVDEKGAITFTTGACVNSFSLEQPIKILLTNRLVKLFKLFKDGNVKFTLGYDPISEDIIQTKVKFEANGVSITSILSCDNTLLCSVPVDAIRERANYNHKYSVSLNKAALIQTINRLSLFNNTIDSIGKNYGVFKFLKDEVIIYDADGVNSESINYTNENSGIETEYELRLNIEELKSTIENCTEEYLCMNFGDNQAVIISRGNVKNIIPEMKLL